MRPTYKITNGAALFETAETRKLKHLTWVPVPNKHDGKGYRRILRFQDGPLVYAAWLLILQVASKCPERWTLADSDGPLDSEDLADKTGFPAEYFQKAFKVLTRKEIGWLECDGRDVAHQEDVLESQEIAGNPPGRIEGKGMEGNRTTTTTLSSESPKSTKASKQNDVIEQIYQAYPRHEAKAAAKKAIAKALKKIEWDQLLEAVNAYAASPRVRCSEIRFIPHPATWFNQERWRDDRSLWRHGSGTAPPASKPSPAEAVLGRPLTFEDLATPEAELIEKFERDKAAQEKRECTATKSTA